MTERTILLASDLTARSDRPTDRAFLLAEQLSASLLLLHVVGEGEADERLEDRVREVIGVVVGHDARAVEIEVRRGEVHREILDLAEKRDPLLIVAGAARFNSIRDYVLGTAVDHLVRQTPVPVLVVKRRATRPYRRLLVATDFSDCSRRALECAAALFPAAELTVWHGCHAAYEGFLDADESAAEVRREAETDMVRFLASTPLPESVRQGLVYRIEEGELIAGAERTLRDGRHDLLVLGTHGRGGFAHATIGSRAAELLECIDSDVLMVRGRKA